jgi:hypothetical protein
MVKHAVVLETLKTKNHIVGDIKRGVKIFKRGDVEFEERERYAYSRYS